MNQRDGFEVQILPFFLRMYFQVFYPGWCYCKWNRSSNPLFWLFLLAYRYTMHVPWLYPPTMSNLLISNNTFFSWHRFSVDMNLPSADTCKSCWLLLSNLDAFIFFSSIIVLAELPRQCQQNQWQQTCLSRSWCQQKWRTSFRERMTFNAAHCDTHSQFYHIFVLGVPLH